VWFTGQQKKIFLAWTLTTQLG